jgi:hypothetical protein
MSHPLVVAHVPGTTPGSREVVATIARSVAGQQGAVVAGA